MERTHYIIRRLLLVIPTFIGITFACFALCQFIPGGAGRAGNHGDARSRRRFRGRSRGCRAKRYLPGTAQGPWSNISVLTSPCCNATGSGWSPTVSVWRSIPTNTRTRPCCSSLSSASRCRLSSALTGFFLTYLVCIPLGIAKAVRNGSWFDTASSVLVFIGYAIPAFAFGMLLKMFFSGTTEGLWDIFPVSGFTSENFAELSAMEQAKDLFMHMFLPVTCYMIGNFAVLTLLMKNSLLEQISQDYVRTVLAKGATFQRAIWGHAFRNSLIPIATGFGSIFTLIFAGSVLIEKVFEIPGMGLLSLDAIVSRDYMVFMGILALTSLLALVGRIFSDVCYMFIDPRIHFDA